MRPPAHMITLTETREITPDVTSACASAKAQATRAKDSHQKVIPLECQPDLYLPPPYEAAAMGCPFQRKRQSKTIRNSAWANQCGAVLRKAPEQA